MLQLSPNPAVDQTLVWAEKPLHIGQTIRITDLYGRVVRDIPVTGPQVWLQRNGLPTGMYLLGLMEKGKKIAGGKVVWVNP
jgi:hypothetical protein